MTISPTEDLVPGLDELERPLTDRERRRWLLRPAMAGTPFDDSDRLFPSFESTGVYDQGQEDAAQIKQMLRRDGRVRQLENVLTLPDRACIPEFRERKGTGAKGRKAVELCQDALGKHLKRVQPQATSSRIFRKAFFEIEWEASGGQVVPRDIAWRPPATCQARFDPRSGKPAGFRQQVVTPDGKLLVASGDELPGWKTIPQPRALIFTHGTHREPITGTSELDVAYWCWESRQKVLYLLFQFLESQSLPKIVAYGPSSAVAQANADWLAGAVSSSVIPMIKQPGQAGPGGDRMWDIIESSGKGAQQFLDAVRYLEEQQVQSVLAGFLQLTELDKSGGSFALGQDARQFFLQSRQADADELGDQIVSELADPLCSYNLGATDLVDCKIGPLSQTETGRALELLKTLATASTMNVPDEFVDDLVNSTAKHVGLDPDKVAEYVEEHAKQRAEQQAQMAEVAAAGGAPGEPGPDGSSPPPGTGNPKDPAGKQRAAVGQNIDSAFELVRRVDLGQDPHDALRSMTAGRVRSRGPNPAGSRKAAVVELARDAENPDRSKSGWIGLYPTTETRDALHLDGNDEAEEPEDLHLTLLYIGPDVTWWDAQRAEDIRRRVEQVARGFEGPVTGKAWAHAAFNPDGDHPCAVYLIGQASSPAEANDIERERRRLVKDGRDPGDAVLARPSGRFSDPLQRAHDMLDSDMSHELGEHAIEQHVPYVPHVTAGYGVAPGDLEYTGDVTFDRVVLHLGEQTHEFELVDPGPDGYQDDQARG